MTEQVYVIGSANSQTVKIGVSVDLVRRLREIQNMSPVELKVLWSAPGGPALEQALHDHFAEIRSHGEWFTFTSDPVQAVRAAVEGGSIVVPPPSPPVKRPYRQPPPLDLDQLAHQLAWTAFTDSRFTALEAADRLGYTLPTMLAHLDSLVAKGRARQRPPIRSDRSRQLFTVRRPA
ncbi:GIY-YIG nuclease family protein (plasmid) [Streptomyces sp. QH1-20]|uniref:GIY-YIG nuclease family protein n=1 Tax=Streptomyces sp. QH1-20 TaxID=3240934 RepID=UPI003515D8C5